jgi:hypothetical protein
MSKGDAIVKCRQEWEAVRERGRRGLYAFPGAVTAFHALIIEAYGFLKLPE